MNQKQHVYERLTEMQIPYQSMEHRAVFTVDEIKEIGFPVGTRIAKNLFLRDAKGKRHFLLVADAEKAIDLRQLECVFESSKLSFASEERLDKYLGLTRGSVSPFGLLNDLEHAVELYLDESLADAVNIGVHPNDNTATVLITFENLLSFFRAIGCSVNLIRFL